MAAIVVIDDWPSNSAYLVTLLGDSGHRVLEASDGAEGWHRSQDRALTWSSPTCSCRGRTASSVSAICRVAPALTAIPVILYSATYQPHEVRTLVREGSV